MKNTTKFFLTMVTMMMLVGIASAAVEINASWNTVKAANSTTDWALTNGTVWVVKNGSTNIYYNVTICSNGTTNITQVNMTLPTGVTFISGSNRTNLTGATFTNSSTNIVWNNSAELFASTLCGKFSFNASVSAASQAAMIISVNGSNATVSATPANLSFYTDTAGPVDALVSPIDEVVLHTKAVSFNYTATDSFGEAITCTLYADSQTTSGIAVTSGVVKTTNVTYDSFSSRRCWHVTCADAVGYSTSSSTECFSQTDEPEVGLSAEQREARRQTNPAMAAVTGTTTPTGTGAQATEDTGGNMDWAIGGIIVAIIAIGAYAIEKEKI
jgi:hypothetical protein